MPSNLFFGERALHIGWSCSLIMKEKKNRLYRDTFVLNPVTRSCNVTQGLFGGLVRVLLL